MTAGQHKGHGPGDIAYHVEWALRPEAALWENGKPVRTNFYPLASDLRSWLLRQGKLRFSTTQDSKSPGYFTNPYTHAGALLSITFAQVVNDSVVFFEAEDSMDSVDAELKRIRLYSEHVLYSARICECFIKQLLFCTTFRESDYQRAALGALLSKECSGCRESNRKRHRVSYLGSLAHRYNLCHIYEGCLADHMAIVNRRRNVETAHSGVMEFNPTNADEARRKLRDEGTEAGEDLIHMLQHIADMEEKMLLESHHLIRDAQAKL
jgi:hypothetical protein